MLFTAQSVPSLVAKRFEKCTERRYLGGRGDEFQFQPMDWNHVPAELEDLGGLKSSIKPAIGNGFGDMFVGQMLDGGEHVMQLHVGKLRVGMIANARLWSIYVFL